jgi:hypothetical protein
MKGEGQGRTTKVEVIKMKTQKRTVKKNVSVKSKGKKIGIEKQEGQTCVEPERIYGTLCSSCGYFVTLDDCGCVSYEEQFCC